MANPDILKAKTLLVQLADSATTAETRNHINDVLDALKEYDKAMQMEISHVRRLARTEYQRGYIDGYDSANGLVK